MARVEAYRQAEKKIEKAQLSRARDLNLSGMNLVELPESLGQLTQLQSLQLFGNHLTELPEWLGQLMQLRSLNLSQNQLTALLESLGQLTQLQTLDLSHNQLKALPNSLGHLTQLQTLDLAYNHLTALPNSLGHLSQLQSLNLARNQLTALPESLGDITRLQTLDLSDNQLTSLPEFLGQLTQLRSLNLRNTHLSTLPDTLGLLTQLHTLHLARSQITVLPESFGHLQSLYSLDLEDNYLTALPEGLGELKHLHSLNLINNRLTDLPRSLGFVDTLDFARLHKNPLNAELAAAYQEGHDAVKRYLRAKAVAQVVINEAKLILIGEGEVGKSCLLGALRGDDWVEGRDTTHGIEIKPVTVTDSDSGEITLNAWDFGGQKVYRPTHQLFFSAPAVYLVVWKPREGSQQGFVKEWIKLVKFREPNAKILVVATHGGPKERQPDIDRQEIWDLFGKDTVIDFFHVDSKPTAFWGWSGKRPGECRGISALKTAIARVAASLPETRRSVPTTWQKVRVALKDAARPYLPLSEVVKACQVSGMDAGTAELFVTISHRLGHLIHYGHDTTLRDIVVLKPDWLATAISLVLDDKETRAQNGLVNADRLALLWNDPARPKEYRYESHCYPIFRSLMERYDLSYRIADGLGPRPGAETILVAQLVPDIRPIDKLARVWSAKPAAGDAQQTQICKVVDVKHQPATAEGLLFWLIVRLHKYSLGRAKFVDSVHWQRGLVLEDTYGARALLEQSDNDIRITVRSPYPERFLSALTYEVQYLVESFWRNLRCAVTVPCLNPPGQDSPCPGVFEVRQLLDDKREGEKRRPCPICNKWQFIEDLLHNAPDAKPDPLQELVLMELIEVRAELKSIREWAAGRHDVLIGRFDQADAAADTRAKEILSKVEAAYDGLIRTIIDEAKEGPRLFSFEPLEPGFWDKPKWLSTKLRVTLWCEHSRLPLPALNGKDDKRGVYEVTVPRDWVVKSAPFLKMLSTTLSLVLPVASSALKVTMDKTLYEGIEKQLGLGEKCLDAVLKGYEKSADWLAKDDAPDVEQGPVRAARGAVLRQLQVWLKEKDPAFGGLIRVQNKRQEFLWVHPQFEGEN